MLEKRLIDYYIMLKSWYPYMCLVLKSQSTINALGQCSTEKSNVFFLMYPIMDFAIASFAVLPQAKWRIQKESVTHSRPVNKP